MLQTAKQTSIFFVYFDPRRWSKSPAQLDVDVQEGSWMNRKGRAGKMT